MAIPPEKYLFDREFERELPEEENDEVVEEIEEVDPLLYTETDMASAIEGARNEGVAAGLEQARSETAQHAATLLEVIDNRLAAIQQAGTVTREEARVEAVELSYLVARKLARVVIERIPQADIEQMIAACLRDLAARAEEPKVRISVPPQLADHITEQVPRMAAAGGFGGSIVVIADSAMDLADCRVEWDEAGAERKGAEIDRLVDDAVQRFLQSNLAAIDPLRNPAEAIERAADAAEFTATDDIEDPDTSVEPAAAAADADEMPTEDLATSAEPDAAAADPDEMPTQELMIDPSPEPVGVESVVTESVPIPEPVEHGALDDEIPDDKPLFPPVDED